MSTHLSRRTFLETTKNAFGAVALFGLTETPLLDQDTAYTGSSGVLEGSSPPEFPGQDRAAVYAVVGAAHAQFDRVKELVTARPALAKASWDWGYGDWESALGAASHTGRRDIAELLMAHGARANLYTFAMLGRIDVVRAICEASPGIQRVHGPHGITLLQHARHGGDPAAHVVEYLEALGDADIGQPKLPIDEAEAAAYVGDYAPEGGVDTVFHVGYHQRRKGLTIGRDDRVFRFLLRTEEHAFAPGGAAAVRIMFFVAGGKAAALSIQDGDLLVRATRITH